MMYEGVALSVAFPGTAGSFAVYPSHAPIIASLKAGQIVYRTHANDQQIIDIGSGFVEVNNNILTVCVEEQSIRTT
jgi:F-type H+-transporting ATPase subunit epsilon